MLKFYRKRSGVAPVVVLLILAFFAAAGGGTYVVVKKQNEKKAKEKMINEVAEKIIKEGVVVVLLEQNNSATTGTARLIDQNKEKTKVVIELSGKPKGVHPAHIHLGACPTPGAVKYPLNNVVNGRSESMIDKPLDMLLEELPLAVNLHKSAAEAQVYIACGNVTVDKEVLRAVKIKASSGNEAGTQGQGQPKREDAGTTGTERRNVGGGVDQDNACLAKCRDTYGGSGNPGFDACVRACNAVGPASGAKTTPATKEFTVSAQNFSFDLKSIKVNKGDTVKVTFKVADGYHDLKIDELNVATNRLNAGQEQTVQFVADKAGQFEYYCSVNSHRAMGMKGMLVVE